MRKYIFKHDKTISAEKSYEYSVHYLILNKDRVVICQVPIHEIEYSKSWKLERNKEELPF